MGIFADLAAQVHHVLEQAAELANCRVVSLYESAPVPSPMTKPCIVVGFGKMRVCEAGFGGYLGTSKTGSLYGQKVHADIELEIYAPSSRLSSDACYDIFAVLREVLTAAKLTFRVGEFSCSKANFDEHIGCTSLLCTAEIEGIVEEDQSAETLEI